MIRYSSEHLHELGQRVARANIAMGTLDLSDIELRYVRPRKRGRRGGVRLRARKRKYKLPLPSIILGNVQSVRNKIDECLASVKHLYEYRDANLLCFTETWLTENDNDPDFPDFTIVRCDRSAEETGKSRGGGVCMFINNKWCSNIVIKEQHCSENIELLSVALRPFYLPREFNQIFVSVVYIHPKADVKVASSVVAEVIHKLSTQSPDSPCFVLGDFNHCRLNKVLPHFRQYVTCLTHKNSTIDLCYGNITDAYSSRALPGLGKTPHNMVQLVPKYRQMLKQQKPKMRHVKIWTSESLEALNGCFECTDWNVLKDSQSLDQNVDVISSYIAFCVDTVLETKTVKMYANDKPWITSGLKTILHRKREAFRLKDVDGVKSAQRALTRKIKEEKRRFTSKLENNFQENNARQYWKDLNTITGYKPKKIPLQTSDGKKLANNLNTFYARFDQYDFKKEQEQIMEKVLSQPSQPISISQDEVRTSFRKVRTRGAAGPDNVSGRLLRDCCDSLASIFCELFRRSLDEGTVPRIWKSSIIVPVAKKKSPKELNDYRPVALTSIPFKCAERIVLKKLKSDTKEHQDPFQFAYSANKNTEDAILTLLHNLYVHLDKPHAYARILFIDFSSAFNTIQPHLLVEKLMTYGVNPVLIRWIFSFLTNRLQRVRVGLEFSDELTVNTGAPQGCVMSPALFTLYTADCRMDEGDGLLVKFADDTSLTGLIQQDDSTYRKAVDKLVAWCDDNFLLLNVTKTKELVIDFRKTARSVDPLIIKDQAVDIVDSYKYLGTTIDAKLDWSTNIDTICKKASQRLFLKKLRQFRVNKKILHLFYRSTIASVVMFNWLCYFSNAKKTDTDRLERITTRAALIIGDELEPLSASYPPAVLKKLDKIRSSPGHPLHPILATCATRRGESSRHLRCFKARTNRMKNSFLPSAVRLFNAIPR